MPTGSARPGSAAQRGSAPAPGAGREVFRLAPPVAFWWVWVAFAVANVADFAVQGVPAPRFAVVVTAILVTVTGLAYVLALRPKVVTDEAGITVVNPFRVHHVPWTAVAAVDTGDWVRVHYAAAAGSPAATSKVIYCWALYLSARTKRRSGRAPTRPPRAGLLRPQLGSAFATEPAPRLPEEAQYLASLPPTKAISVRLDKRAAKERARSSGAGTARVAARWSWPAIAAVVIPALALLIVALI